MPGAMSMMENGLPRFTGTETVSDKVEAIQNYLYMFLEELRYILQNLGSENFNENSLNELKNDVAEKVEGVLSDVIANNIRADTIISNTFITNELYSAYGEIADLVVAKLRTDYRKIQNYLRGIRDDVNYISIHDEQIDLLTDSVVFDGITAQTEQLVRDGRAFYWKTASQDAMTSEEVTPWPVIVYKYNSLTKATLRFTDITLDGGQQTYAPLLTMGAGDQLGYSKGYVFKNQNGLELSYTATGSGDIRRLYIGDSGVEITRPLLREAYGPGIPTVDGVTGQLYFQYGTGAWVYDNGWNACFAVPQPEGGS